MAPVMKPKVVISQDGFDGAVKENMEDFDMSLAEAVEDAIKTFQMQGANLSGQDTWMDEWMHACLLCALCCFFMEILSVVMMVEQSWKNGRVEHPHHMFP